MRRLILLSLAAMAGCASHDRLLLEPQDFGAALETEQLITIEDARGAEQMLAILAVDPARVIVSLTTPLGLPRLVAELQDSRLHVHSAGASLPLDARELVADLQFAWWPAAAVTSAYGASPWTLVMDPGQRALKQAGRPELTVVYSQGAGGPGFVLEDHRRGVRLLAATSTPLEPRVQTGP